MSQEPLLESLKRLGAGQILPDDISKLQQALSSRQITIAAGGIAIGGNVSGGVVGNFVLPADVLKMLHPAYQPPSPPPKGTLAERGPLPPGHRVPFSPNAVFTGRHEYLTDLADILLHPEKDDAAVVVTGIGGVGKSQLAVEFCYRYGRFLEGIHWIQANLNISAEVAECGLAMGLPGWTDKLPEQVAATIRAWQEGGRRLIVLDNAEDLQLLYDWMPRLQPCRLLITSRRDNWPTDLGLQTKRLDELTRIQSKELLRKLAPRLQKVLDNDLDDLADHLGDLPLALDLAGRYLAERTELSIEGYLQELEAAGNALEHTSLKDWVEHNPTNHPTSLAVTFALSWDQLGEADELARLLFRTGGYCAPNTLIPRQLFVEAICAKGSDPELDRALRKLESLGLMQLTEGGHRMHTLLAEFARLQDRDAKESALPFLADAMVALTNQALENGLPEKMVPLREHLEIVAQAAEEAEVNTAGALWSNFGVHLRNMADFLGAKTSFERALVIDEMDYGPDHPNVANISNNLGSVLQDLSDLHEAKECFERALKIDEQVFGSNHPNVARDLNNLGWVLKDIGDLQDARECFERALKIDEQVFGSNHPNVARDINNNLGWVLKDMGDLRETRECFERALKIDEQVFGSNHPNVARDLNNLGLVLKDIGDLQDARECFERALKIDEQVSGSNHPNVARDLNNLGWVLKDIGDPQEARKCFENALKIYERIYGPDHPNVARDINYLGWVLKALGKLQEARKCFERALKIDEQVFGSNHPNVARDLNNLGWILQALGELKKARKCYERALKIDAKVYGPDHLKVANRMNNLGMVLKALGNLQEASRYFESALRIYRQKLGEDHPTTKIVKRNLELLDS